MGPIIEQGQTAAASDDVVLGPAIARSIGADVGDSVTVATGRAGRPGVHREWNRTHQRRRRDRPRLLHHSRRPDTDWEAPTPPTERRVRLASETSMPLVAPGSPTSGSRRRLPRHASRISARSAPCRGCWRSRWRCSASVAPRTDCSSPVPIGGADIAVASALGFTPASGGLVDPLAGNRDHGGRRRRRRAARGGRRSSRLETGRRRRRCCRPRLDPLDDDHDRSRHRPGRNGHRRLPRRSTGSAAAAGRCPEERVNRT